MNVAHISFIRIVSHVLR